MVKPLNPMMAAHSKEPVYSRSLGWCEYDDDGDSVPAMILAVPAFVGFDIFRIGQAIFHLEWFAVKEDAVDWAVDRCRVEVSEHEPRQVDRD